MSATPKLRGADIDRAMRAELRFPSGHTGAVECSMWSTSVLKLQARVVGERGELRVFNPTNPQMYHRVRVTVDGQSRTEHVPASRPTTCSSRRSARRCCGASRR